LIITHEPGRYNYRYVLSVLSDLISDYQVIDAAHSVILLKVSDPYSVVKAFKENNVKPGVIYRVIPVDSVVDPYVEIVAEECYKLASMKLPEDKTYRISLRGRLYWYETRLPAHTMDAIRVIAEKINRKVSLEHPEYLVYIRSIKFYHRRRYAAITVTETSNILSFKSGKF